MDPKPSPSVSSWKIDSKSCLRILWRRKWSPFTENHVLRRNLDPKPSPSASSWKIDTKSGLRILWRRKESPFKEKHIFLCLWHKKYTVKEIPPKIYHETIKETARSNTWSRMGPTNNKNTPNRKNDYYHNVFDTKSTPSTRCHHQRDSQLAHAFVSYLHFVFKTNDKLQKDYLRTNSEFVKFVIEIPDTRVRGGKTLLTRELVGRRAW